MADKNASVGDKRKKSWKMAGHEHKRHKADASTAKGSSGILVTCDRTKERQSVRDALNLLNDAADKYFPAAAAAEDEHEANATATGAKEEAETSPPPSSTSVQQALQEEIAALRADAKKRVTGRFTALDTGVKGVLLIQIKDPALSAVALVTRILEEVDTTKEFPSRFVNRMIPLEKIGFSSTEDMKAIAEPMIQEFITAYQADASTKDTPIQYAVEIKRRNCSRLDTREAIEMLAGLVGPDHKVNLTTPNVVVLVEVFRNTFGMSVVTNFHTYRKFNVRSILDPPTSSNDKPSETKGEDGDDKSENKTATTESSEPQATEDAVKADATSA